MSSNISSILQDDNEVVKTESSKKAHRRFWFSRKEINEFASQSLQGTDKKRWEMKQLAQLGIQPRNPKPKFSFCEKPLPKIVDASMTKVPSINKYLNQLKGNRRGDKNSVGDGRRAFKHSSVGQFRKGVLLISPDEISRVPKRKKGSQVEGKQKKKVNLQIKRLASPTKNKLEKVDVGSNE